MLKLNFCEKKHAVPNECKSRRLHHTKCILKFPAQSSPFLGTMENTIFGYLTNKSKYFKSNFVLSSNIVLATERIKSRSRFVLKSVDL